MAERPVAEPDSTGAAVALPGVAAEADSSEVVAALYSPTRIADSHEISLFSVRPVKARRARWDSNPPKILADLVDVQKSGIRAH